MIVFSIFSHPVGCFLCWVGGFYIHCDTVDQFLLLFPVLWASHLKKKKNHSLEKYLSLVVSQRFYTLRSLISECLVSTFRLRISSASYCPLGYYSSGACLEVITVSPAASLFLLFQTALVLRSLCSRMNFRNVFSRSMRTAVNHHEYCMESADWSRFYEHVSSINSESRCFLISPLNLVATVTAFPAQYPPQEPLGVFRRLILQSETLLTASISCACLLVHCLGFPVNRITSSANWNTVNSSILHGCFLLLLSLLRLP